MKPIRRILVAADPGEASALGAQRAVERALQLALRFDAELQVFIVCDYNDYLRDAVRLDPDSLARAQAEFVMRKRAWLAELAESLDARAVPATVDMAWDRPLHDGITRRVLSYEPDLVVKDLQRASLSERALFTNADWHLIRECPAPLLLVRSEPWPSPPRILAAVDPMHENDKPAALDHKILDTAGALARALGGELHVLHAYETVATTGSPGGVYLPVTLPSREIDEKRRLAHQAALRALAERHGVDPDRTMLRAGRPAKELIEAARELPAALVVMGAVARSGLTRLFIGSTAEKVLQGLPCDVLVVKADGFRTPVEPYPEGGATTGPA